MDFLLFLIATGPGVALLVYFYQYDRLEPEPKWLVLATAAAGALSALVACSLELALEDSWGWRGPAVHAFVVVGLSEELCKLAAVLLLIYWNPELDEPYDGVVYCVAAGMGFAVLENLRYVYDSGAVTGFLRALMTVPAHALFGVSLGYFVGQARFARRRTRELLYLAGGLACAVLMHGLYDYLVYQSSSLVSLLLFPLIASFWLLGLRQVDRNVSLSPYRYTQEAGQETQRRAWVRIRVRLDAQIQAQGQCLPARVVDIGMGGALIEMDQPLARGELYSLSRLGDRELGAEFDVLRVRPQDEVYVHHCRFATLTWRMQKRLEVVLKHLLPDPAGGPEARDHPGS